MNPFTAPINAKSMFIGHPRTRSRTFDDFATRPRTLPILANLPPGPNIARRLVKNSPILLPLNRVFNLPKPPPLKTASTPANIAKTFEKKPAFFFSAAGEEGFPIARSASSIFFPRDFSSFSFSSFCRPPLLSFSSRAVSVSLIFVRRSLLLFSNDVVISCMDICVIYPAPLQHPLYRFVA